MQKPKRAKAKLPFGENLKKIMKDRGLTHRHVAEMAGCGVSVVNDWCCKDGSVPHDLTRVSRLAKALGVSFQWLLLSEHPDVSNLRISDLFDEMSEEKLSGYFKIEVTKLTPKK